VIECLFLALLILLALGVPISVAMLLSSAVAILLFGDTYSLEILVQKLYSQNESFPLLAVPLFIFAGRIMGMGGMSDRLIALASAIVGNVRGGLAMVSVIACIFFAAISGSTAATTAAIGTVLMPAIVATGFSKGSATSLQATAGSIGIIIPPSIPFVLMGVIGGISIGELFVGGILPGVLTGAALMMTAHLVARREGHPPSGESFRWSAMLQALVRAVLPLFTVILIVGVIIAGIVTPTEAAILAVVWSLFVSLVLYREMGRKELYVSMVDTVKVTGVVVLCIGSTAPFAWLLTVEQVPQQIGETMMAISSDPIALKLMMVGILLAAGTFLDLTPAMIILVPILFPIARTIGMDPVQFGVITVMALGIGQCTPPVGIALFVACGISKIKIGAVARPLLPFLAAMLVVLLLAVFWPFLTVGLPAMWMR
jgi:C4-dicarboxylate transporter, DctM subunit